LNEALVELSLPLPAYTDAVLGVGVTGIKRAHIAARSAPACGRTVLLIPHGGQNSVRGQP